MTRYIPKDIHAWQLSGIRTRDRDSALKLWLETFGLTEREMFSIPEGVCCPTVPTIDDVILIVDPAFSGATNAEELAERLGVYRSKVLNGHCYGRHTLVVASELADNRYESADEIRRRIAIEILRHIPPQDWQYYADECLEALGLETGHNEHVKLYRLWRQL